MSVFGLTDISLICQCPPVNLTCNTAVPDLSGTKTASKFGLSVPKNLPCASGPNSFFPIGLP